MAAALEVSCSITGSVALGGNTSYQEFGDSQTHLNSSETGLAVRRTAGAFSQLAYNVLLNSLSGSSTVVSRKNSVVGGQALSISAGLTGIFQDLVNVDTVAAGDVFNARLVTGAGTSLSIGPVGIQFSASSLTVKRLNHAAQSHTPSTTVNFCPVAGGDNSNNTAAESQNQYIVRTAATLQNLFANVSSNTNSQALSIISRKNTANGSLSLSVAAGLTGNFEDLVNTDRLASGDLIAYAYSVGATNTGSSALVRIASEFVTSNGQSEMFGENTASTAQGTSLTWFHPIAGLIKNHSVTETDAQSPGLMATASRLQVRLAANSVSAASTFKLRKNAGNVNQSISITASTSGLFEDAVNSDALLDSDLINYQLITGGTGTSLNPSVMGIMLTVLGIPVGTLSSQFLFMDTGQYGIGTATDKAPWLFFSGSMTTGIAARAVVAVSFVFRKTLSFIGTRIGSRQSY